MRVEIHIQINYPRAETLEDATIRTSANAALAAADIVGKSELTLTITGEDEIRELNQKYRQIDAATDVLSFPDGSVNPENGRKYLGDIIIAFPVAVAQADQDGHSAEEELQLLVVHGVLHLLGYDHYDDLARDRMWAVQKEALAALGSPIDSRNWQ